MVSRMPELDEEQSEKLSKLKRAFITGDQTTMLTMVQQLQGVIPEGLRAELTEVLTKHNMGKWDNKEYVRIQTILSQIGA